MEQSNRPRDTGRLMGLVSPIVLLGLLASLSPATIVVFILLLATTRAKVNVAAFLIGWSVLAGRRLQRQLCGRRTHGAQHGGGRIAVEVFEILLGIGLIFAAKRQWQTRNQSIRGRPQSWGSSSNLGHSRQRPPSS